MSPYCQLVAATIVFCGLLNDCSVSTAAPVDFQHDVAPILTRHCLRCHNDRDRRGELSLQSAAALTRGGESGDAVVPRDPDSSYLLDVVVPVDGVAPWKRTSAVMTNIFPIFSGSSSGTDIPAETRTCAHLPGG